MKRNQKNPKKQKNRISLFGSSSNTPKQQAEYSPQYHHPIQTPSQHVMLIIC
jgi:hypothetical protein